MSDYRTRDQLLLAKIEAAAGTEETPTAGANAVKVRPVTFSPNFEQVDTDYVQSGLSQSAPQTGGGSVSMSVPCFLKGAGTAGEAPDYGPLLRACALSETLTATDVTGTATAGAAGTITLAAGASAVTDAYKGMVIAITGGTGNGQKRVISGYAGGTKMASVYPDWQTTPDATSQYTLYANALYRPVSAALELLTLWHYQHRNSGNSRRRRLFAGAGSLQLGVTPRQLAELTFNFTGRLPAAPDDQARPAAPTYGAGDPRPFIAARAYLGGAPIKFSEFSFDLGNDVQMADDPAAAYGFDLASIVARSATGRIVPSLALTSVRDSFTAWLDSQDQPLWLDWGTAAGERASVYLPAVRYTGYEDADVRGFAAEGLPFRSVQSDEEIFICLY